MIGYRNKKKRVGAFGSAVNPPTLAHRAIAEVLTHSDYFDLVLFVPSGSRPDKPHIASSYIPNGLGSFLVVSL